MNLAMNSQDNVVTAPVRQVTGEILTNSAKFVRLSCYWCGKAEVFGYRINRNDQKFYVCEEHWDRLQEVFD
jgi:predicted RNA-binding Zn-ribbon protein involved in translation (DUF1610 family)